jgi:hypothetical protein
MSLMLGIFIVMLGIVMLNAVILNVLAAQISLFFCNFQKMFFVCCSAEEENFELIY